MNPPTEKRKALGRAILRIGMALVFLWFGIDQIIEPNAWIGFIPEWVLGMVPLSATVFIYLNAAFEIVFGAALLFGLFTRFVAFLLFLHIADITLTVGFSAIGVRDFGLSVAMFTIFLNGGDFLSLDKFIKAGPAKNKTETADQSLNTSR